MPKKLASKKRASKKRASSKKRVTRRRTRTSATKDQTHDHADHDHDDGETCLSCGVYTAEGGETLASLASQFSLEQDLLAAVNPHVAENEELAPFEAINVPSAEFDLSVLNPPAKARSRSSRSRSRSRASTDEELALFEDLAPEEHRGPSWYRVALDEMTLVAEQDPAPMQDLRYVRYLMTTNMASTNDESATGSAFVHWCLVRAGLLGTGSTSSLSWLEWPEGTIVPTKPAVGAIVVFAPGRHHESQGPHVALYAGADDDSEDTILALGCHTNNQPSILPYPTERIVAYCWPLEAL